MQEARLRRLSVLRLFLPKGTAEPLHEMVLMKSCLKCKISRQTASVWKTLFLRFWEINEQLKIKDWLAYCLATFIFILRTEGVKGGALLPLTSTTTATKWLACELLAKPLLYFAFWGSSLSVDTKNAKIQLGRNVPRKAGFHERTLRDG